jgi:hypothetical protein
MYNVLNEGYDTNSGTDGTGATQTTPITQTMTMTTGSTLGNTYVATNPSEIFNAINQITANQTAIMTQMAAMSFNPPPPPQTQAAANYHNPPIQQLNIPTFAGQANVGFQLNIPTFAGQANVGFNAGTGYNGGNCGCGGGRGRGRGGSRGAGGQGGGTLFANPMQNTQAAGGRGGRAPPGIEYLQPAGGFNQQECCLTPHIPTL